MKGDRLYALVRAGTGSVQVELTATVAGRNVTATTDKDAGITWLVLTEETRGGTVIRESRIQMPDVIFWEKNNGR